MNGYNRYFMKCWYIIYDSILPNASFSNRNSNIWVIFLRRTRSSQSSEHSKVSNTTEQTDASRLLDLITYLAKFCLDLAENDQPIGQSLRERTSSDWSERTHLRTSNLLLKRSVKL